MNEFPKNPNKTINPTTQIYVVVHNHQAKEHASLIEIQGTFFNQPISIFIDLGAIHNFISPNVIQKCKIDHKFLSQEETEVEFGSGKTQKIKFCLRGAEIDLGIIKTKVNLWVTQLGSYDLIQGMDCYNKKIEYLDDQGRPLTL